MRLRRFGPRERIFIDLISQILRRFCDRLMGCLDITTSWIEKDHLYAKGQSVVKLALR